MPNVKYVSVDRLDEFLTALKGRYAANETYTAFSVQRAAHAVGDEDGLNIKTNYALKTSVQNLDAATITDIRFKGNGDSSFASLTKTAVTGEGAHGNYVEIDISDYALKSEVAKVMEFKGAKTGAELAALTASDVENGDVYTCITSDSGTFHVGFEYVAVKTEVTPATDPKTYTLSWIELGKYDNVAHTVTGTTNNMIACLDANGDLASTGINKSVLSDGQVANGNASFVTGDAVYQYVAGLGSVVNDVQIQVDSATPSSVVSNGIAVIPTTASVTQNATELVQSGAVYTAIGNLSSVYSKVVEDDGATQITTLQEASAEDISGLFA